jgi:RimJ/RimL family protein N-acetyltransferase
MPSAESVQRVDEYWTNQLAISWAALQSHDVLVAPLPESNASFCFVFNHHGCTCVRVPLSDYKRLAALIEQQEPNVLLDADWWRHQFENITIDTVGAAYLGYADAITFRAMTPYTPRLLTPGDAAGLAEFAAAIGPIAWEHSGLDEAPQPIAGCWEAETLVAAAGYTIWDNTLAHIGVATHPAFRGRGYGTAVVSTIGEHALAHGYVLQYRTLLGNTPSIAIAQALGFQLYATTLFLHLKKVL